MNILLRVDQQAALRRGINAPSSTITLDVTPDELTQQERDVLAAVMVAGHDCTRLGLQTEPDEIVGQAYRDHGEASYEASKGRRYELYGNGAPTDPLLLSRHDMEGLHEAIGDLLAVRERARVERLAEVAAARENMAARVASEFTRISTKRMVVSVRRVGGVIEECMHAGMDGVSASAPAPSLPYVPSHHIRGGVLIEPDLAPHSTQIDEIHRERAKIRAALFAQASAELVKIEAQQQLERAEYAALYARLPESLRARYEAGFEFPAEIEARIRGMILEDAGLPPGGSSAWSEDRMCVASTLTEQQYARLVVLRAAYQDAVVPLHVWEDGEDGEEGEAGRHAVARLTLCRGGVTATVYLEL